MIKSPWHRCSAAVVVLLFLVTLCVRAQDPPTTRTQPVSAKVESKTGAISGRVVTEDGQPLVNVNVWVRPATPEGLPVTHTTTNRDGVFKVTGLERGSYSVNASVPSYIPKSADAGPTVSSVGDSVTLVLIKGGVVTGTVTNPKGDPVVGIGVRVEMLRDEIGRNAGSGHYFDNVTDDRGIYRVYGVPTGTYIVSANGGVNYAPGNVNAYANDMPTYAPSSSRESADVISVRSGEETSVDIRYRGARGSTISGIVSGYGNDKGSWVTLTSIAERGPRLNTYFEAGSGEFAFEGVPDGDYHLAATTYGNGRNRGMTESMLLSVRGADIEGLDLTAHPLASISGRMVLEALKTPPPECTDKRQPEFSNTSVTSWHRVTQDNKKKPQFIWRSGVARLDPQGNFMMQDLPPNEYYFGARVSFDQWYLRSIMFAPSTPNGKPTDAMRTWTTVKPGDRLSGLTLTLAQGGALVRGSFTVAEGQTLPEKLVVYLVPAEAEKAEDALRYFAAPVNSEGSFWLHYVAPGRYWMVAQPGTDDTRYETSKVRLPDAAELRSSLRHAAEQSKTEIEVKPCQDVFFRLPL